MSRQAATSHRECGAEIVIRPTLSPWNFEYTCVCRRGGIISWAHEEPPPTYDVPPLTAQMPLFEEEKP